MPSLFSQLSDGSSYRGYPPQINKWVPNEQNHSDLYIWYMKQCLQSDYFILVKANIKSCFLTIICQLFQLLLIVLFCYIYLFVVGWGTHLVVIRDLISGSLLFPQAVLRGTICVAGDWTGVGHMQTKHFNPCTISSFPQLLFKVTACNFSQIISHPFHQ